MMFSVSQQTKIAETRSGREAVREIYPAALSLEKYIYFWLLRVSLSRKNNTGKPGRLIIHVR